MREINFTKMVACGNDFVIVGPLGRSPVGPLGNLARKLCNRKYGIGADGLLILERSKVADIKMRIFNSDGSEARMCGNGARCVALYISPKSIVQSPQKKVKIETKAGIITSRVSGDNVKIKLTAPRQVKLDIPIKVNNRSLKVNFIDTGVPHAVIFVEAVRGVDVCGIGRFIRNHKKFAPRGTNVDFVEVLSREAIKIRTYERGVEDETLACGTGAAASALIFSLKSKTDNKIDVHTQGRDVLRVYFTKLGSRFNNIWLGGKASRVFKGQFAFTKGG